MALTELRLGLLGEWARHSEAITEAIQAYAGPVAVNWLLAPRPEELTTSSSAHLWLLSHQDPHRAAFRQLLIRHEAKFSLIGPSDDPRSWTEALDALSPWLQAQAPRQSGLFSRLQARNAQSAAWRWTCENCDDPDCEHRLRGTRQPSSQGVS